MDRSKTFVALGVVLLLIAGATIGAIAIIGDQDDHYAIEVEIVSPEEGATVAGGMLVAVEYESNSKADLAVLKVDHNIVATSTQAPFEWEIDTTAYLDGEHVVQVLVRNEKGRMGSAEAEFVINNGGTSVSIRSPSAGATASGQIEIKVDAVSPRGISYVSLRLDGEEVGNISEAPFTFTFDTTSVGNGEHTFVAKAWDELGVGASASSSIMVDNPFSITDGRGKVITFQGIPKRILSMGSSFTEVLYAIDAQDLIIGVDSSSKYPAEVSGKTNVGSFFTINLEAVLATNPDCIVTWTFATTTVSTLESHGLKVVCYYPGSVSGVMDVIASLGELTGRKAQARELTDNMNMRLDAVKARVAAVPVDQRPDVYFELRSTKSVGPGTIANELITIAGGRNIYSTATIAYPLYNSEYIVASDPDVIVIENQSAKTTQQIKSTAGWSEITAVEQDRIFRINGELVSATPRLVDAVEQMEAYFFPG